MPTQSSSPCSKSGCCLVLPDGTLLLGPGPCPMKKCFLELLCVSSPGGFAQLRVVVSVLVSRMKKEINCENTILTGCKRSEFLPVLSCRYHLTSRQFPREKKNYVYHCADETERGDCIIPWISTCGLVDLMG